jgi:hypothetical protein
VNAADYAATAPVDAAKMLRDIVLRAIARLRYVSTGGPADRVRP